MSPQFQKRIHPAQAALRAWAATQPPDIWQRVEQARMAAADPDPRYYVRHAELCRLIPPRGELATWSADVALASGWGAWRMTQGIYRYDPAVYEAVRDTPIDRIPVEVLDRMPEWAVMIETPDWAPPLTRGHPCAGVLVWRNRLFDGVQDVLMLVLLAGQHDGIDYDQEVLVLPLADTLDAAIARRVAEAEATERLLGAPGVSSSESAALRDTLPQVISLLLYLCSEAADITHRGRDDSRPGNPEPKRTRRDGWRIFAAEGSRAWDVGLRLGAALRRAYHAKETGHGGTHAGPRPHIRRAHWHGFRSGPMKHADGSEIPAAERQFALKWLPPIPVNLDCPDDLPATIRPVSKG